MLLGLHEVPGTRLPLTSYASSGGTASQHTTAAVFMYSTSSEGGVTLQLRDADDFAAAGDDKGGLASVLARLQEDAALSISYQADSEALGLAGTEESLDHFLLGSTSSGTCLTTSGNGKTMFKSKCELPIDATDSKLGTIPIQQDNQWMV
ncbi:uncharacterized protein LOC113469198 [Diaphorina citri]|uniref:Uncharacterized protein LOC113469198 n=1 Tax=Diaphorina citri TaxID=121845 RepID=A0A3Q0J221_DIACI|nr:uncharacterized protein LOC113469198 [Diaphorina citri]